MENKMRLCPHDEMHDRIRRAFGYVRDGQDNHHSVCALCWVENSKNDGSRDRFHSPHGGLVCLLWTVLDAQETKA